MRELLWVQLAFDLAMLFALLALERSTGRRRRPALLRRETRDADALAPAAAPDAGLAELVERADRAERQELVAEPALRQRLTRFRESAG
jgi:hypothetical protein